MNAAALQEKIDALSWYHEYDFGGGLRARSKAPDVVGHRQIWAFIEKNLNEVDFQGKSVLDIGCWDGYWSFYAERRGARSILATDDVSQNWADGQGIHIAKELLRSSIDINQGVSVYDLASLGRKFDIVLFLGVFYHLHDPFYALAQIRHCCHDRTLVLMEGTVATALGTRELLYNFEDHRAEIIPDPDAMGQLVKAAYFKEIKRSFINNDPAQAPQPAPYVNEPRLGWRWRLRMCRDALRGSRRRIRGTMNIIEPTPPPANTPALPPTACTRMFLTCAPFEGVNPIHYYKAPFGLHRYDDRFRTPAAPINAN
jgi:tRNA (mo5U34)-methyltransferase